MTQSAENEFLKTLAEQSARGESAEQGILKLLEIHMQLILALKQSQELVVANQAMLAEALLGLSKRIPEPEPPAS